MPRITKPFNGKINPETISGEFIFFYPADVAEAEQIEKRLQAMGFRKRYASEGPEKFFSSRIGLLGGEYFSGPNEDYTATGKYCATLNDLDSNYVAVPSLRDLFFKLSDRLDAQDREIAELKKMVTDLHGEVMPRTLNKPGFNEPKAGSG